MSYPFTGTPPQKFELSRTLANALGKDIIAQCSSGLILKDEPLCVDYCRNYQDIVPIAMDLGVCILPITKQGLLPQQNFIVASFEELISETLMLSHHLAAVTCVEDLCTTITKRCIKLLTEQVDNAQ